MKMKCIPPQGKRGKPDTQVGEDEEYTKVNPAKFSKLATVFQVRLDNPVIGKYI